MKFLNEAGKYFVGFCIGLFIAGLLFTVHHSKSMPTKIIENPTKQQEKKADVVVQEKKSGQIDSRVSVSQSEQTTQSNQSEDKKILSLTVGDKFTAPATGKITTTYLDQYGKEIGTGDHSFAGDTIVTVNSDSLDISTQFQDSDTVTVNVPETPKKLWWVGGDFSLDINSLNVNFGYDAYIQKNFLLFSILKKVDVYGYGKIEKYQFGPQNGYKPGAGIVGNF